MYTEMNSKLIGFVEIHIQSYMMVLLRIKHKGIYYDDAYLYKCIVALRYYSSETALRKCLI